MRKHSLFLACLLILNLCIGAGGGALAAMPAATPPPVMMPTGTPVPDDISGEDTLDAAAADSDLSAEDGAQDDTDDLGETAEEGGEPLAPETNKNAPAASPSPTPEPTAAPVINHDFTIKVDMGYEGLVMMSHWTPSFVTVTNNGSDFDGILGVNVYLTTSEYDRYEMPLTLASGATKHLQLPIKPQTRQDMYAFELTEGGAIIAEERVAPTRLAAPETMTIGVLSDTPEELSYLNQRANGLDTLRGEIWLTIPLTADNFPATLDLMSSFSMLVIDGIDVRTLSDAQQESLTAWLLKGGLVFVSGGAKAINGYPFFAQWTDLSGAGLTQAQDITPQLLSYAAIKGTALDETLWLSDMPAKGAAIADESGAYGLLHLHRAGDGLIFSAAFDMGGKPLSSWQSSASFWPRMLRQAAASDYMKTLNRVESSRYDNDTYYARSMMDNMRVKNEESGLPVLLILAAYLLVVGFGAYLLLRRVDHREWLWAAAPLAAFIFALLLFGLSRGSTMNDPVALTASRIILEGDGAQVTTYIGIATPASGELTIETDQRQLPTVLRNEDYYYYDDVTRDRLFRPITMRQRYRLGANPAVGFISSAAWDVKMMRLSGLQPELGTLETRLWMESDGMHGETSNGTDQTIRDCFLLTSFGFSQIGDVLPGQTVAFSMLYPEKTIDLTDPDLIIKPNTMYSTLDIDTTMQSYYGNSIYNYLEIAIYGHRTEADYTAKVDPEKQQRMSMMDMFSSSWSFYEETGSFYFFGFNDDIGKIIVSLNGAPVERTAHNAVIGSRAVFEPIGPTGQVMFPQGAISAELMADNGDDKPRPIEEGDADANSGDIYNSNYLTIGAPTALRFVLPEWETYTIERLAITGISYDSLPTMYLYNHKTDTWDEQLLLSVSMDGKKAAPYIDEDGSIYVRYLPGEGSSRYHGMNMPTIALKGEVK